MADSSQTNSSRQRGRATLHDRPLTSTSLVNHDTAISSTFDSTHRIHEMTVIIWVSDASILFAMCRQLQEQVLAVLVHTTASGNIAAGGRKELPVIVERCAIPDEAVVARGQRRSEGGLLAKQDDGASVAEEGSEDLVSELLQLTFSKNDLQNSL